MADLLDAIETKHQSHQDVAHAARSGPAALGALALSMAGPTRAEVDRWPGGVVLEFGASWCSICQRARPMIDRALAAWPELRHVWIEDARTQRLGRTFGVKLWPTLVVLRDGAEVARVVRPRSVDELDAAFAASATPRA